MDRVRGSVILAQRSRIHLVYRLTGRTIEALAGYRSGTGRRIVPRTLLFAAFDIGTSVLLRRSEEFHLLPRLAADAVDTAMWSTHPDLLEPAVLPGVPLAVESGARLGLSGLIVPATSAVVTALAARRRGHRPGLSVFRWQIAGVALGVGLVAYEANRRQAVLARHDQELEAQLERANLAGQHEVAMAVDSVVDLICRTTPLLAASGCESLPGRMLASWKQALADTASAQATYLGVAVARWQHRHNSASSDLHADVVCGVGDGVGTMLLSSLQAGWLEAALDDLDLRGPVRVTAVEPAEAGRSNQPTDLLVNDAVIHLPSDPGARIIPFDPGPLGFLAAAMWTLDSVGKETRADPWAAGPVAAAQVGLAVWAHRTIDRMGDGSHWTIVRVALASGVLQTIATMATMQRTPGEPGLERYPFLGSVNVLSMLVALYSQDLTPGQLLTVAGGLAATTAIGLVLAPKPLVWIDFISGLLWTGASVVSVARMNSLFGEDADSMVAGLTEQDEARLHEAFSSGRALPLRLATDAQRTMRVEVACLEIQPPPELADEVNRRLAEIDRRLEQIRLAQES